jgi:hypothetical protein
LLSGATVRVAMSMVHHRDVAVAAGEALGAFDELLSLGGLPPAYARVPLDAFDAVLEVQVPDEVGTERLIDCFEGMVAHLDADVDLTRSCALIGVEHTIIEGDGPVQLFYAFRRIPSISHEDFVDYWLHRLVRETSKTPGKSGYRQLHADCELSGRLARSVGVAIDDFDGVALEWYPSVEDLMTAVRWASEPKAAIIESESNINDFKSSLAMLAYDAT